MPYSKDPSLYPTEFQEIFRRATAEEFSIDCGTPHQATNMRHQFHAYRRAMEYARTEGWTELRRVSIKLDGTMLHFSNNNEMILRLREAAQLSTPSEEDLDKYLEQLDRTSDED